jgi:FAD:protein FMN transferase
MQEIPLPIVTRSRMRWVVLVSLSAFVCACSRTPMVYQRQLLAMGTLVDVSIDGVSAHKAQAGVEAVAQQMHLVGHRWHAWKPSRLTRINRALEAGRAVSLTPRESRVIREAMTVARRSDYLFDPAIGKLVALWGFHTDVRPKLPPPPPAAIQALVQQHPSMADLTLKQDILRTSNRAVQLDFGGFAKGLAINRSIAALKQLGINNAIVNAGGDMRVIGNKDGHPWRIGIKNPRAEGVIAAVDMQGDESIYTSGDYERFFIYHGKRYCHIIDPRTGMPAPGVTSVTVIHQNAAIAEAADKALFIAGPAGFARMAARLGVSQAMLIDTHGTVYMTPAMARRVHFEIQPAPKTEIVKLP